MSFQANRRQSQPDDGGYALPIVIVVIAVGAMVAIALLGYAAALLRAGEDDADSLLHLYAADAGITAMKDWLERGRDPDEFTPFLGGDIKLEVTAHTPTPTPVPTTDPNPPSGTLSPTATPTPAKAISLKPELPNPLENASSVIIKSVPQNSALDIRWATSTPRALTPQPKQDKHYSPPSIEVYLLPRNTDEEETLVATSVRCPDDPDCPNDPQDDGPKDYIWVRYNVPDTRGLNLRIVFNSGTEQVRTRPGRSPPCTNKTLCVIPVPAASSPNADQALGYLPALQEDYIVVSTSGDTTVTAYIRQIPGWCLDDSSDGLGVEPAYERCDDVKILSWKPYPRDPPDEDEDP